MTNRLTESIQSACQEFLLDEKWLIAPSLRVGHQWLESVARSEQPVLNARVKTLRSMAVDLVAPEMAARGITLATPRACTLAMERALKHLNTGSLKYLAMAQESTRLTETVWQSVDALGHAGLEPTAIETAPFEVVSKGQDLRIIARAYLDELSSQGLIDFAEVLRFAKQQLINNPDCLGADTIVMVPADARWHGLERELVAALPTSRLISVEVDTPATDETVPQTANDIERLRWLRTPSAAPEAAGDSTVKIVRAVGEVNEVRDVLRSCHAGEIRLDNVELLHTDAETYVPLVYEVVATTALGDDQTADDMPVTFAEGIPSSYSRPGRLLAGWLEWIREGFPQNVVVRMLREGLLTLSDKDEKQAGFTRLAARLRRVGIGIGRERYLDKLDQNIHALEKQIAADCLLAEEEPELHARRMAKAEAEIGDLRVLRATIEALLKVSPSLESDSHTVLAAADGLVQNLSRRITKLDRYAAQRIGEEIADLQHWLQASDTESDIWQWLEELPQQARVLGSGPRPGCLHVDSIYSGGHSGRRHTFIVGLDDGRFPGAGMQDPLLLDSERRRLSPELSTAAGRLEETVDEFARLLARLRGQLTLSFSSHDVVDDREMFPSPVLSAAFRVLSGNAEADQSDLLEALDPPVSFAPASPNRSLDAGEWWLWRLCGPDTIDQPLDLLHRHFPRLAEGFHASQQRQSDKFTAYDGRVPAAGKYLNPTVEDGRVLSASGLKTLAQCPLRFFYQYGLGIKLPDEVLVDASRWLDALAFGSLLHELFEQFMRELLQKEQVPVFQRDHVRLEELLSQKIAEYADLYPPPSDSAWQSQSSELRQAAATFLREDARFCEETDSRPVYLEASLGLPADGHGTPLDSVDPVPLTLPNGKQIRTRGRIDRIDQIGGGALETYAVWDYKSGSPYGYDRADPFCQGRLMQPLLYVSIVAHRLKQAVSKKARVVNFGFFFPGRRAAGHRVSWSADELRGGMSVLENLCQIINSGAFLATNEHEKDCTYCDYRTICGDVQMVAEASQRKLDNRSNRLLKSFRELRTDG